MRRLVLKLTILMQSMILKEINYNRVSIGTQVWIAENLKTSKYRNGDAVPYVTNGVQWGELSSGSYCWYNNDAATYKNTYGAIYNWFAAHDSRFLCPTGWHIPSDEEWTKLTTFLGGETVAGGKLKETGFIHWQAPNKRKYKMKQVLPPFLVATVIWGWGHSLSLQAVEVGGILQSIIQQMLGIGV